MIAFRRRIARFDSPHGFIHRDAISAGQTYSFDGCAMQFDHVGGAGALMQPVNVLRDHCAQFALAFEFGEGVVPRVRLGVAHFRLHQPLSAARIRCGPRGSKRIPDIRSCGCGPNAAGAAEVGDAGFSRNAGAGETDYAVRFCDQFDSLVEIHRLIIAHTIDSREPL